MSHDDHFDPHGAIHEDPKSFFWKYLWSTDHKMIGRQFLLTALLMFLIGGVLALVVRLQLGCSSSMPGVDHGLCSIKNGVGLKNMTGDLYNQTLTMHASFMIFFAIIPLLIGAFGNFVVPLQIGARDMAFPNLNAASYWLMFPAIVIMIGSYFVKGGPAQAGWTSYPPLTGIAGSPGLGQTLWLVALILVGTSSIMGAINYLTTIVNMRAPGMTFFRLPLTTWSVFVTSLLVLLATPVLASNLTMLLLDRTVGTSFFFPAGSVFSDNAAHWMGRGGGVVIMWQHIFWFYSHPAVYIMILPAMGIASEVLSTFARKPIFGYKAMVFSMLGIAFIGFIVWGHHMFASGMNPYLGTYFAVATVLIAIPSAIKTFNWLGTLWGANIKFTTAMLYAIAFVGMFAIGGLSGIFMASTPLDLYIHDTYFIVAHIHYVLFGGSMMGIFAGIYFWYPKMFGRMMSEFWGKVHFIGTLIFFNGVFFPMHIIGIGGHMRRIADPAAYEHLKPLQYQNVFMSWSALLLGLFQIPFILNFLLSLKLGKKAESNPWHANSLEWSEATSPPPHHNYTEIPTVLRGAYEFGSPEAPNGDDYLTQAQVLPGKTAEVVA